jgi:hypothetical protein
MNEVKEITLYNTKCVRRNFTSEIYMELTLQFGANMVSMCS